MAKQAVYLCGPINGCTDDEASGWRREVAAALVPAGFFVLDPMRRDFRGKEAGSAAAIVHGDLFDIQASGFLLVNAARPSWGTAMEVMYAARCCHPRPRAVAFAAGDRPSPWLAFHCHAVVPDLAAALDTLARLAGRDADVLPGGA